MTPTAGCRAHPALHRIRRARTPAQPDRPCGGWLLDYLDAAGKPVKPANAVCEAGYNRHIAHRVRQILGGLLVELGTGPNDPQKRWGLAAAPTSKDSSRGSPVCREPGGAGRGRTERGGEDLRRW